MTSADKIKIALGFNSIYIQEVDQGTIALIIISNPTHLLCPSA